MPDDLGYDDLDDQTPSDDQTGGNSTINAIRKAEREAKARAKAAEEKVKELEAWKEQQEATARKAQVSAVAASLGLPAGQAALVPSDIEPTPEAVGAWAVAHDLLRPEAAPAEVVPQPTSFVPVTGQGGVAPDTSISYEAFQTLYANPATRAQAEKLFAQGRVTGFEPGDNDGRRVSVDVASWK